MVSSPTKLLWIVRKERERERERVRESESERGQTATAWLAFSGESRARPHARPRTLLEMPGERHRGPRDPWTHVLRILRFIARFRGYRAEVVTGI